MDSNICEKKARKMLSDVGTITVMGKELTCPICGNNQFYLGMGYIMHCDNDVSYMCAFCGYDCKIGLPKLK